MAKKISELTTISSIDDSDILPVVDVSANTTNKITISGINQSTNERIDTIDEKFNYSTTEQVVGTWIDNKPIYRQVFTQTNTNNISNVAPNNDNIIKMECYIRRTSTNAWRKLPWLFVSSNAYGNASWAGGFYFNNNTINFQLGSDLGTIDKLVFIIEYTKTTD